MLKAYDDLVVEIRSLHADEVEQEKPALATLLLDCVAGGASVSFLATLTRTEAEAFFGDVASQVGLGSLALLGAYEDGQLVGSVQVHFASAPNQAHRADIAKLLVLRSARRRGIASMLMTAAEGAAREAGRTLLVLDTSTGSDAERLYVRLGWTRAGEIPNYARLPTGELCGTTIYWKQLD